MYLNDVYKKTDGCVRFVPRTNQVDFIEILKAGKGCFAYFGHNSGKRIMSLDDGCLSEGTIQHEALHVLGFDHAHSRSDRDNYVRILLENVKEEEKYNFNKHDTHNERVPFDYSSVMLYHSYSFSRNGRKTIEILNPKNQNNGGKYLTPVDVIMIKRLYNCQ